MKKIMLEQREATMKRAYWLGALAALLAASNVSHAAEKIHVATPSR